MKDTKMGLMLGIFLMVIGVGTMISGIIINEEGTIGDCYDKHNNKIIGQSCELEVTGDAGLFIAFGFELLVLGTIFSIPAYLYNWREAY